MIGHTSHWENAACAVPTKKSSGVRSVYSLGSVDNRQSFMALSQDQMWVINVTNSGLYCTICHPKLFWDNNWSNNGRAPTQPKCRGHRGIEYPVIFLWYKPSIMTSFFLNCKTYFCIYVLALLKLFPVSLWIVDVLSLQKINLFNALKKAFVDVSSTTSKWTDIVVKQEYANIAIELL